VVTCEEHRIPSAGGRPCGQTAWDKAFRPVPQTQKKKLHFFTLQTNNFIINYKRRKKINTRIPCGYFRLTSWL
jgi:hypothetical protein